MGKVVGMSAAAVAAYAVVLSHDGISCTSGLTLSGCLPPPILCLQVCSAAGGHYGALPARVQHPASRADGVLQ